MDFRRAYARSFLARSSSIAIDSNAFNLNLCMYFTTKKKQVKLYTANFMRVTNFSIEHHRHLTTFSADFSYDRPFARRLHKLRYVLTHLSKTQFSTMPLDPILTQRQRVWFSVPSTLANESSYQDAFFIVALILALKLQQKLEFEGSVSPGLVAKIPALEKYYRFESSPRRIPVTTAGMLSAPSSHRGHAQFFTLGVDSFYTLTHLLKSKTTHPHLLFVDGYDIPVRQKKFLQLIHSHINTVATATGCTPVFMHSNLREFSDEIMNWGQFHVAALAAISYLLPYQQIALNGESFDWPDWGLRFGVDHLFSTSSQQLTLVGHHLTRDLKIKALKRSPFLRLFLEHVRVCWKNVDHSRSVKYNCSRCQKCLRTMLLFRALDLTETPTFEPLDLKALKKVDMVGHVRQEWTILYTLLLKKPQHNQDLLRVLTDVLQKPIRS